jgi:hypothetical protein
MNVDINNFVIAAVTGEIKKLYLSFLYSAEDLVKTNKLSEEDYQWLRKRILDYGNNSIRNIDTQLNSFDFSFRNKENNI